VSLDAYTRRLDGLVLAAPSTGLPFATDGVASGSGRASGLALSMTHRGSRVSGHATYALAATTRETAGQQYRPWFGVTNTLSAALGYRPTPAIGLRAALIAAGGRPASITSGDVEWAPAAYRSGSGDVAGSPEQLAGSLGSGRLAPYLRLDVGARYAWHPAALGFGGGLAATLSVSNLLDRTNELGIVQTSDGSGRRALPQQPRTVWLGLEWTY